jgi:hypothetical protein
MEMEMDLLYQHYNSPEVLEAFPAKMEKVVKGELPHSGKILTSLYQKLAQVAPAAIHDLESETEYDWIGEEGA